MTGRMKKARLQAGPRMKVFQDHRYSTGTLFCCQSIRNLLTVLRVNVTACQAFTTWQAVSRSCPARIICTGSLVTPPKPSSHFV